MTTPDLKDIDTACQELARRDGALARAYAIHGPPDWRVREQGFEPLIRAIAYQQISVKAAASIWGRVEAALEGQLTPEGILAADPDALRSCGLSRPKVSHISSIAEAVHEGRLCFERLAASNNDIARAELVAVKGIGPWTADIYLMSSLGRMDAFPEADLGLIEAYRMLRDDEERFKPRAFSQRAEAWRPWRAVAALQLWGHINAVRDAPSGGAE